MVWEKSEEAKKIMRTKEYILWRTNMIKIASDNHGIVCFIIFITQLSIFLYMAMIAETYISRYLGIIIAMLSPISYVISLNYLSHSFDKIYYKLRKELWGIETDKYEEDD